jgi:hypothetical protein
VFPTRSANVLNQVDVVYGSRYDVAMQCQRYSTSRFQHNYIFLPMFGACLGCCCFGGSVTVTGLTGRPPRPDIGGANAEGSKLCPLALGFSGDRTPCRGETPMGLVSPVTFRRTGGRAKVDDPIFRPASLNFSFSENSVEGIVSPPMACRRAFSCLACTVRK